MSTGFILGEDGKVHIGEVEHHIGHTIMLTDCKIPALRPMGLREKWWIDLPARHCDNCIAAITAGAS